METAERFRAAVEKRDLAALDELFTEDVRLYSPVKFVPFEGKAMVMGLFGVLLRTFEDLRYLGRLEGEVETTADGEAAPTVVLPFRALVAGRQVHGIDQLQFDGEGRIKEFTVMVRPQSAVHALGQAVLAGLVEDGLVEDGPAPGAA
ncbi:MULTISPECIES: nuclear transport factor 2 family protein [Streptomyces]|uniref:Serine/arginine repetitive matrix protein 1 n=1 Tax=Streptomyces katrae TaxID=68223 RepID=A0A0F4JDP1_9ACTN|nr:nuclear transport factor 2 family protein [Streptomyces katrae]KJY31086.1 serine/arginine repetitive matrix protein 1 [Streptomyces katrae]